MSINKSEIEHIAKLSRLELTDKEEDTFSSQISSILEYMEVLNEIDVKNVSGTAFVGDLHNVWRSDNVEKWSEEERELALNQSEREDGLVKVKRVIT
ncbi:MAG: Asp-tRNA(Asn)/Glu-tRNA(Gln) amidotransferase subunit GatC [Patescibacteria group bacterium]|jgi:aspartyl-tRNA(Asn)/glutamyl-tRNA(Gln) amidotransferase subunit C|nr:Asp-tRNA(Asn)/Glu-tRNA(Gln) amidotransferase subunit GatC [Patescibacteria group bacterium]